MRKIYGAQERQDGLYRIGRNKWEVIFGFGKDSEDATSGYNYRERFDHQPTLDEIKAVIFRQVDEDTDRAIEYGLVWNGLPVHLDSETQGNIVGMLALLPVSGASMFPKHSRSANTITASLHFMSSHRPRSLPDLQRPHQTTRRRCILSDGRRKDL